VAKGVLSGAPAHVVEASVIALRSRWEHLSRGDVYIVRGLEADDHGPIVWVNVDVIPRGNERQKMRRAHYAHEAFLSMARPAVPFFLAVANDR